MTINDFKTGIATAAWNMNLIQFCEVLGLSPDHSYAQQKFLAFQDLAEGLNKFTPETLSKLISATVSQSEEAVCN